MKDLEHAEPASLPSTTDYQTFVIPSLPSENLPAERIEEDPEDNIELRNKLGILNTLEARMEVLDSPDEYQDDQSPCDAATAPSLPTVSRHLLMPAMMEDPSQEEGQDDQSSCDAAMAPSFPMVSRCPSMPVMIEDSSQELAGPSHDNHSNVADSDNELRQYWAENPRPMTLLPIGTIIETIDNPDSTMELQRPMHIWHEFVKLETEPNPDDVCPHFITIQG